MKRIFRRNDLVELARELGVRPDWHEPEEQGLSVVVKGNNFDNAGFWVDESGRPEPLVRGGKTLVLEKYVILKQDGKPVAAVNLATLFAWACGFQD